MKQGTITVLIIFLAFFAAAQSALQKSFTTKGFIENKGQIIDQNNKPNPEVLYLLNSPGMNVQLRRGGFSYDLYSVTESQSHKVTESQNSFSPSHQFTSSPSDSIVNCQLSIINFHRIDFNLIGSNPACQVIPSEPSADYLNYYTTGTPTQGVTEVRHFSSVTCKDIYPGIDLEFVTDGGGGYKYNFLVHPGGDVGSIRLNIEGPDKMLLSGDTLKFSTSLGEVNEVIPESYLLTGGSRTTVKANFREISHGVYGFAVDEKVPGNSTLVIDPTCARLWGTYYGGEYYDAASSVVVDSNGNVFISGSTKSYTNIATAGAYQSTKIGSNQNGFLAKFYANGIREWGTYYGGSSQGWQEIRSSSLDSSGNIYLAGVTTSDTGIATQGAHQTIYGGGGLDGFLAKFSNNGIRLWATYYGGLFTDDIFGMSVDNSNNAFIVGSTYSPDNIATPGSYQPVISLTGDGFIAKFDSNGVRLWGTYYGGILGDGFNSCANDSLGNLYAVGITADTDNITTTGAFQEVYGGGWTDAFLVAFSPIGQRLWATYYGGLQPDDGDGCRIDSIGNIYIYGQTSSSNNISSTGAFQESYGGSKDGFIAKFNNAGQRLWGTYYGGINEDAVTTSSTGSNNDIFFGGLTYSPNGISTPDAYMPSFSGMEDAFFCKFNPLGQRQWGSYFGGESSIGYYVNLEYKKTDTLYLTGGTNCTTNISTPNGHQQSFGGSYADAFLEKFIECWPIGTAGPMTGNISVCVNTTGLSYSIPSIAHAVNYVWTLPPGATIINGSGTTNITVNFSSSAVSGNIWVKGLNKCNDPGDSAFLYVTVHPRPVPVITGPANTCAGPGKVYSTTSGMSNYQWSVSAGGLITYQGTSTDDSATVTWTVPGNQTISVNYTDANGCAGLTPTVYNVTVDPSPAVGITISVPSNIVCAGAQVTIIAVPSNEGSTPFYQWKVNGLNVGTSGTSYSYTPLDGDVVSCVLTSSITGCILNNPATSNTVIMGVDPNMPVNVTIAAAPNPYCTGDQVTITATPDHGGLSPTYLWKVNDISMTATGPVFTYTPVNGDQVRCYLTSSLQCTTNNPAMSNNIVLNENSNFPAGVNVTATSNPFCPGTSVTYTAWPTNGGSLPSFQWRVNGINTGSNLPTYTYSPQPGDSIRCIMTSNLSCVTGSPASSAIVIMSALPLPAVTFTTCFDTITTLNAKPIKLKGGLPYGGTYSGPGVNSATGIFTPSAAGVGTHTITYSYTNALMCSASNQLSIINYPLSIFNCGSPLTDIRDNKVYPTVQIGTQCWMQTNLDFGTTINDLINQTDNCIVEKYTPNSPLLTPNSFYQWDEVMRYDPTPGLQGLCPPGWHVPDETEWNTLFNFYQGNARAGYPLQDPYLDGFKAFQNGVYYLNAMWSFTDFATLFWSSTMADQTRAYAHGMNTIDQSVSVYAGLKANGFSVRCLKD